ncbi:MAG: hypothetical protein U1F77_19560 [Kiritimatiellia bacterium]
MRFAKYWVKGFAADSELFCWGWSDESPAAAEALGRQRAQRLAEMLDRNRRPDSYTYGDHPIREAVTAEWKAADGGVLALLTVNIYGADILNTSRVMFVDVDITNPKKRDKEEAAALGKLDGLLKSGGFGARVYRTAGGLRYILTLADCPPKSPATATLMGSLGADPLYVKLCHLQDCYRARLTPKPWRCGFPSPAVRFPYASAAVEADMANWREKYLKISADYAVCEFLDARGRLDAIPAVVSQIAEYHDRVTKAQSGLELA